ncbi:MAG: hypothetical protein ABIG10_04200 [bacterium]
MKVFTNIDEIEEGAEQLKNNPLSYLETELRDFDIALTNTQANLNVCRNMQGFRDCQAEIYRKYRCILCETKLYVKKIEKRVIDLIIVAPDSNYAKEGIDNFFKTAVSGLRALMFYENIELLKDVNYKKVELMRIAWSMENLSQN